MNEIEIMDMYVNQKLSTYVIAEKLATYPNKVRRMLKKLGIKLNDHSEAQKLSIKAGRSKHPTLGIKRDQDVKNQISETVFKNWQNLSDEKRQKRVDQSKKQWYNMTEAERESLRKAAAIAVRQASRDGSKMENFLSIELTRAGYDVIFHKIGLIPSDALEVDIFLPSLNTAIEIDGPAHFFPIWGDENLQKHIKTDAHKTGLLLLQDIVVIRIKHLSKNLSEKHKRDILNKILSVLIQIKKEFPKKGHRYIELEIK